MDLDKDIVAAGEQPDARSGCTDENRFYFCDFHRFTSAFDASGAAAVHQEDNLVFRGVVVVALDGMLQTACGNGKTDRFVRRVEFVSGKREDQPGAEGIAAAETGA